MNDLMKSMISSFAANALGLEPVKKEEDEPVMRVLNSLHARINTLEKEVRYLKDALYEKTSSEMSYSFNSEIETTHIL